jgi:hypothetical protein
MSTPENPNKPAEVNARDNPWGFTTHDPVHDALHIIDSSEEGSRAAGYELSDANVNGLIAFLSVMAATLAVFFVVCYAFGKLINHEMIKYDGPASTWAQIDGANLSPAQREIIVSDRTREQQQLAIMTKKFPTPRLQLDDGDQDTADLHSREDLLLNYYSYVGQQGGAVRIPIDRAMHLIAQRGLPVIGQAGGGKGNTAQAQSKIVEPLGEQGRAAQSPTISQSGGTLAGTEPVVVTPPLTDGFARTAWEQQVDEERHQELEHREAMKERR